MLKKYRLIPVVVFFVFVFLFFMFGVDPRLLYHAQEPAFLLDAEFFYGFAGYPGGLVWYASAFLTQFYRYPFAGAAIVTLLMLLIYRETAVFLKSYGIRRNREAACFMPSVLLVAAYGDHMLPLSYALGMLIALLFSNIYSSCSSAKTYLRLSLFIILAAAAYYLAGTGALLLAALCVMNELVVRKNAPAAAATAAIAALLPFIAARTFFVISVQSAYYDYFGLKTALLEAARYPRIPPLVYGAYLFYPAAAAVSFFLPFFARKNGPEKSPGGIADLLLLIAVIAAGISYVSFFHCDKKARANYRIDYLARHGLWDEIIRAVNPKTLEDYSAMSQAHLFRALYWRGRLLSELFTFPQGLPGLSFQMVTGQMATRFPVQMSDLYFEIGALNQAEYWAHEALALRGKKPYLLRRLALINLLKGRKKSAGKFITLLGKTPLERKTVAACNRFLGSDSLIDSDAYLGRVRSSMPRKEYVCRDYYSELVNLFEDNSENRTAFEYLVAENLLNNSISPVVDNAGFFARFGYDRFPRHVQEALVFQAVAAKSEQKAVGSFNLDNGYFGKFDGFNRVLFRYANDRAMALKELAAEYGTTYWYYLASNGRPVLLKE
ncbi:MAG: hypothetical protein JW699_03795 [Chitinispirillaceae bacterium]|nr:hypothetical protein [Chitinispirillaceae bacterium]